MRWTSTVNIGACISAGPGHNPPIPHPRPNNIAPTTSFQSIKLFWGLNNFDPNKGYFLTLIMYWKTIKLTMTPAPRTNINDGFQLLLKAKNIDIFDLLTIPATKSPAPKINPTKKTIIWSLIKYYFVWCAWNLLTVIADF